MADRRPFNVEHDERPLREVVAGLDVLVGDAIPYSLLPRRLSLYAAEFPRWGDIAGVSLRTLSSRPKLGPGAIRALVVVAGDAVRTAAAAAGADDVAANDAVGALVARLDDVDRTILAGRCWTFTAHSQADIAKRLGVHKATVERNQPRAERRFAELAADPAHRAAAEYAARLGARLGLYVPTATAAAELGRIYVTPESQTAHVLLHMAGPYRQRGEWLENVSAGGRARVAAALDAIFDDDPAPTPGELLNTLTALGMSATDAELYLRTHESLRHFGSVCVRWHTESSAAMAEAVLHGLGAPATIADIHARLDPGVTSLDTFSSTLAIDPRFVRASRRTWGLRTWNLDVYRGVAHAIGVTIDRHGGSAPVATIFDDVLTRFPDVAESSVRSNLSTLEFVIKGGIARRRTPADGPRKLPPLNAARGVFRNGNNEIRVVIEVNGDVMRGSSHNLRVSVAHALGVEPGAHRTFASDTDAPATTLTWKKSSTRGVGMTAPRAHANRLSAGLGDQLIFAFDTDSGVVTVTRLDPSAAGLSFVRQLVGRNARNPVVALAASLDCAPSEVVSVLRTRGDDAVVARAGLAAPGVSA